MTLSHGHKGQQQQILSSSIQEFILTRNKTPKCANHIDPHEQHMSQSQPKSTQQTLDVKCPQTLNKHQYKIQEAAKKKFFGHNSYITPKKQKKQKKRKKKKQEKTASNDRHMEKFSRRRGNHNILCSYIEFSTIAHMFHVITCHLAPKTSSKPHQFSY